MAHRRKHNSSFLAKEAIILVVTVIMVIIATEILHRFAPDYGLTNLPLFGNVLFGDYESVLKFCSKVAVILVYIIRPLFITLRWSGKKGTWHKPKR